MAVPFFFPKKYTVDIWNVKWGLLLFHFKIHFLLWENFFFLGGGVSLEKSSPLEWFKLLYLILKQLFNSSKSPWNISVFIWDLEISIQTICKWSTIS